MEVKMAEIGSGQGQGVVGRLMSSVDVIDLSVDISERHPAWYIFDPAFRAELHVTYDSPPSPALPHGGGGFFSRTLTGEEHLGTHFDAPAHIIPPPHSGLPNAGPAGLLTTERIPFEQFHGPAAVIDCTGFLDQAKGGMSPRVPPAHIEAWEAVHGPLAATDRVLLRTGYSDAYYRAYPEGRRYMHTPIVDKTEPGWPAPADETLELLASRGVRLVGTDGSGMGPVEGDYSAHVAGLRHGMIFVEKLIGLERLPLRGAWFFFMPIKVIGGGAAPGRAFALVAR
jgi:kynurenine formamidase